MRVEKVLEWLVAASGHARKLRSLEGIHCNAADEGDVDTKTAVHAGAGQAHEDAELGRGPLRAGGITVNASVVLVRLLNFQQLCLD
jgi:hypothetical protein